MLGQQERKHKLGGLVFLLSLVAISALSVILSIAFFNALYRIDLESRRLAVFASGLLAGGTSASLLIRGKLSVFLHELKHSILSNLVGNRAKRLSVSKQSGAFEYYYSRETEHMNAFIALAPYCLPLFTVLALVLGVVLLRTRELALAAVLTFALGIDLVLNLRDVGPHQTDFSELIGGFRLGIYYTCAVNLSFVLLLCSFSVAGMPGLSALLEEAWNLALRFCGVTP